MSVSIMPGATALTRIPNGASSFAADRMMPRIPAFDAAYAVWPALPLVPTIELTSTIDRASPEP